MANIIKFEENYQTEVDDVQVEQFRDEATERGAEEESCAVSKKQAIQISGYEFSTSSSATENLEAEHFIRRVKESLPNEDSIRHERAKANALMDTECLAFLNLFSKHEQLKVDELSEYIKKNSDWLKIALLIKADYLQSLDSTVRMTTEGVVALKKLDSLKGMSKSDS